MAYVLTSMSNKVQDESNNYNSLLFKYALNDCVVQCKVIIILFASRNYINIINVAGFSSFFDSKIWTMYISITSTTNINILQWTCMRMNNNHKVTITIHRHLLIMRKFVCGQYELWRTKYVYNTITTVVQYDCPYR